MVQIRYPVDAETVPDPFAGTSDFCPDLLSRSLIQLPLSSSLNARHSILISIDGTFGVR
jgi:hypothetical protein